MNESAEASNQPHTSSDNESSGRAEDSLQHHTDDDEPDLQLSSPDGVQLAVDKSVFKLYMLHVFYGETKSMNIMVKRFSH
jgi:hypothetical protein